MGLIVGGSHFGVSHTPVGLIAGGCNCVSLLVDLIIIITGGFHWVSLLVHLILGGSHCQWISLCLIAGES